MTDPLGQSQVINYLIGLSKNEFSFDILSFEKPDKFKTQGSYIKQLLFNNNIGWYPQVFHSALPVISKILDKVNIMRVAKKLHKKNKYDLIHCRSYPAAEVGLKLKKQTGVKFLFDMRGFWADEKVDGNAWNRKKWFWNRVYLFYKAKEKQFIIHADHIISLTRKGKEEIMSWPFYNDKVPITVIPCCADSDHFSLITPQKKEIARKALGISEHSLVLSYLGSLGTWYMLDEMLDFFELLYKRNKEAIFLIITNSLPNEIKSKLIDRKMPEDSYRIISVPFQEVPQKMYSSDVCISFIKPVYSKISSSPVKIGEILSMGLPVIGNDIGDSGNFIEQNNVGALITHLNKEQYNKVLDKLSDILNLKNISIRETALKEYSLVVGTNKYSEVYKILNSKMKI